MGILFSVVALFSWGIGDFLIQKSARKFGDWIALFYITAFGSIILFPFVYKDLGALLWNEQGLIILSIAGLVMTFAAYFEFEALRIGKISIIEPINAFEIAMTGFLATIFLKEFLNFWQIISIIALMVGIFLVATKSFYNFKYIKWEKGVIFAIFAMIGMGTSNFLFGIGSRITNPLLINWFANTCIALICLIFLTKQTKIKNIFSDLKDNTRLIVSVSFIDNLAWVCFSYATLYIPIAIATGISESYIALAAILGIKFNQEKLKLHQKLGLTLTIVAAIFLAFITKD